MIPDYVIGTTLDFKFSTRAFATGVPTTLAGSPVISAYPNNSTTELTAGITLTVDFDSVTGLHNIRVVATTGNGYATSTTYALVITAGTVDGVSVVGEVVGQFSLERSSARVVLGTQATTAATGDPTTSKTIMGYVKQLVNVLVGSDGVTTFPAEAAPSNAVSLAEVIRAIHADVTGLNGDAMRGTDSAATAASVAALNDLSAAEVNAEVDTAIADAALATASALATVDSNVDAVLVDTAEIGTAGAGLTAVPWNASWDAEVQSEVVDALQETVPDSIPSDGTRPNVQQAAYMMVQALTEFAISGTTVTVKKPDGTTTLFTCALDSSSAPTSTTRAS